MNLKIRKGQLIPIVIIALGGTATLRAQDAPFGEEASVEYAESLWNALIAAKLVGTDAVRSFAYAGNEPHGVILEQAETTLSVDGRTDSVIVKHNYMREDGTLTADEVINSDWNENLVAVTVMFRRESNFNPDANDWFWAKFLPDGTLDQTPQGVQMAGRVSGCIQCHAQAPGGDYIFLHDRMASD